MVAALWDRPVEADVVPAAASGENHHAYRPSGKRYHDCDPFLPHALFGSETSGERYGF